MSLTNDFKERIESIIELLPPLEERAEKIQELNEEFYQITGSNLPPFLLELLGSWYLREAYMDKSPNKIQLTEYPFHSEHQQKRRERRTILINEEVEIDLLSYHQQNNSNLTESGKDRKKAKEVV